MDVRTSDCEMLTGALPVTVSVWTVWSLPTPLRLLQYQRQPRAAPQRGQRVIKKNRLPPTTGTGLGRPVGS